MFLPLPTTMCLNCGIFFSWISPKCPSNIKLIESDRIDEMSLLRKYLHNLHHLHLIEIELKIGANVVDISARNGK
jgi:hypothetical protein